MLRLVHSFSKVHVTTPRVVRTFSTAGVVPKAVVASSGKPSRVAATKTEVKKKPAKKANKAATADRSKTKKKKKVTVISAEEHMLNSRKPIVAFPKGSTRSGYMEYFKEQFSGTAAASNPSMGVADAARETSLKWKRLSESEKAKYTTVAQAQRAQYEKDLVDWWRSVDHKLVDLENKRRRRFNRSISERAKAGESVRGSKLKILRDPFRPKFPMTSYMRFCKAKLTGFDAKGELSLGQRAKQVGAQWRSMSAADKAPYVQAAATELAAYKKAVEKYVSNTHH
ncbi:hypothetical protein LPJ59_004081 [Coemansia sp. RSA 2399]|nr:hypothetical protein LPJ59_004081 [Coemansia sp. RSA 2399]